MKLSEAMRLGAMLKPQGFGLTRPEGTACALDAVALAATTDISALSKGFPILDMWGIHCPECGPQPFSNLTVGMVIAGHLNDDHRWTRERIADWIEAEFESSFGQAPPAAPENIQEQGAVLA